MAITLGGVEYSDDEVIAAIAASNDPPPEEEVEIDNPPADNLTEVNGILTAIILRLAHLEDRFPQTRAGFGVIKTPTATGNHYRVQTLDPLGRTVHITYEIPN